MTVILFLIILAILIFVHELGHFLTAKFFGIRVDEFAIGFPPRIFSRKYGETQYSLNLIPIGGYVKIFGEDPNDESLTGPDSARSFVNASKWKQIVILLSGIFMNLLFAWILISIAFNIGLLMPIEGQYRDKAQDAGVMIISVLKDSPSDLAGLKEGDKIISIESGRVKEELPSAEDLQKIIAESSGKIDIVYKRGDSINSAIVSAINGISSGKKAIGISMGLVGTIKFGFFQSFYEGFKLTIIEIKEITTGIYKFIYGMLRGQDGIFDGISGPVGIASLVGQASGMGISYLFGFVAMISINLAMLNLVPFPALDGGRVLFVLIESAIRRKIKPTILNWTNLIGFVLLIFLLIFITYKDILALIR